MRRSPPFRETTILSKTPVHVIPAALRDVPCKITLAAILLLVLLLPSPAAADSPISIDSTTIVNDYPQNVTFEVSASSTAGDIDSVKLFMHLRGSSSVRVERVEFEPGPEVLATYEWSTFREQIPPGTPVEFRWSVRDDAGNTHESDPEHHILLDARSDWHSLENDNVALWWYEGDDEFGQLIFDSAAQALADLQENTGQTLPYRIHIVVYGSDKDFDAWHDYVYEWVAGEAFPQTGLAAQIIPPASARVNDWYTKDMMPHEIAHLFFYAVTHSPTGFSPPTWLNEGFSQYHEFLSQERDLEWVRDLAGQGELIPLRVLGGKFTGDDERIHLQYAESLSAVTFLFEQWGQEGVGTLLGAFRSGLNTDKALQLATGLGFEEFQLAWWRWLGGAPNVYPTSAARSIPTAPPLNTRRPPATPKPSVTPTGTPPPTRTVTPQPLPSVTASHSPTAPLPSRTPTPEPRMDRNGPCPGPFAAIGGLLGMALVLGRHREPRQP